MFVKIGFRKKNLIEEIGIADEIKGIINKSLTALLLFDFKISCLLLSQLDLLVMHTFIETADPNTTFLTELKNDKIVPV